MSKFIKTIVILIIGGLAAFFALRWLVEQISPRPENLGVTNGRLAPCPKSPNCVSTGDNDAVHGIDPIPFTGETAAAQRTLLTIIQADPRYTLVTIRPAYLHFESRSDLWQFIDDVEFYLDTTAGVIHFRSAARLGYGDGGVNRQRMEEIRAQYPLSP